MSSIGNLKIIKTDKRLVGRQRSLGKNKPNKFEQLYNNYITIQAKKEKLKQKIISEREKNEKLQCTFTPKLTKMKKIFSNKLNNSKAKEESSENQSGTKNLKKSYSKIDNLIYRQNIWLQNKNNKLKKRIVTETMKKMEKYVFEPKLNQRNKKTISNLKTETLKIIERPDFYLNYIQKNKQYRKNKSNSKVYEYPITHGEKSPNKLKLLKLDKSNDYDYTRHQLTERSYLLKDKSNSNFNNISITNSNKSVNKKEKQKVRKSFPKTKLKASKITVDELYKKIYLREKENLNKEIKDYINENIDILFGEKEQIYFKEAMERLHNSLINLNLNDEQEDESNSKNGNIYSIEE